jgi:dCMP deaminase
MERREKDLYYLDIAEAVAARGTCLRRNYGAIIVKNDEIVSTGYTGAPRGRKNCCDLGNCRREELGIPRGERYELCRSVHSEANAIISASRDKMIGATLYLTGKDAKTGELVENANPCTMCKRMIINAGITKVIVKTGEDSFKKIDIIDWIFKDDSLDSEYIDY